MKDLITSISVLILVFFILVSAGAQEMRIRKPAVAGQFYSDEEAKLSNEVESYLGKAPDLKLQGEVLALIVPHAGYTFSGAVAAYAYKAIENKPKKTVILIGPSHQFRYNYISILPRGMYETPLGQVPINEVLAQRFLDFSDKIRTHPLAHYGEHSLEVQLPFLQKIWGNEFTPLEKNINWSGPQSTSKVSAGEKGDSLTGFTIVPILMGSYKWDMVEILKEAILNNLPEESFILIASSDMSHYHNYEEAAAIDKKSLGFIKRFDIQGLYNSIERGQCEWCGAGCVLTIMEVAKELGADKVRILKYANSGDTAPPWLRDKERVVGYSAIAFYREEKTEKVRKEEGKLSDLDKEEQRLLLEIARASIENALEGENIPEFQVKSDGLKKLGGAFVTLNKSGRLRGCIGFPEAVLPLYQAVSQAALSAALKDHRFPPVTKEELPDIEIEISVLSPLEKIADVNRIEVGKHGLVIRRGIYSGLLLPQVAAEYGWDRAEFLERICEKAGLPRGAWRENAEVYIFTAQVFHEKKR